MYQIIIKLFAVFFITVRILFKSKGSLILENLAIRQQLSSYLIKKTIKCLKWGNEWWRRSRFNDSRVYGEGW